MGIHRTHRKRRDKLDAIETKARNRGFKTKERARRLERMMAVIRSGSLPYAPAVMSWLSRELGIRSSRITAKDIAKLGT